VKHSIQDALWHGITSIAAEQLPHGEIPNYRRLPEDRWEYCFSLLVSAYVYSALGCFDPSSTAFDLQNLEACGAQQMQVVGRMAFRIRRGIYRFLCWQQSVDGTWGFFGQGSSLPPDLDTTSCAAVIFLDRRCSDRSCGLSETLAALSRFRLRDGTFDSPNSRGPGFAEPVRLRRVANANLLRCLALAGMDYEALAATIGQDLAMGNTQGGMRLALLYALGRAYRQGQVSLLGEIAWQVLEEMSASGVAAAFQGPLSAVLMLSARLDFGSPEIVREVDIDTLIQCIMTPHRSRLEAFCDERCGSPALTTAIAMSALSRAAGLADGGNGHA
jgi:hypothetical protein